jgi:hypothetical protein
MAVDDVYRLTVRSMTNLNVYQNSWYFRRLSAPDPSQADALALANDWKETLRPLVCNDVIFTTWELRQVRGASVSYSVDPCNIVGGILLQGGVTGSTAGTDTADMLPPQNAFVVTILTGLAGRRRRGRTYIYGVGEGQQASGSWFSAYEVVVSAAFAAQIAQYATGGTDPNWRWVVWSHREASGCAPSPSPPFSPTPVDPPSPGTAAADVVSYTTRTTVFNQRRRTVGVGR